MVRGNISGHTDWKVDHIQTEKYIPTLDFYEAIGLAPFSVLVYLLSLYSIRNIFKFLNRKKGRAVNQMIFYQQVLLLCCSPQVIITTVVTLFVYPVVGLIGSVGCYVIDFMSMYSFLVTSSSSFYISLFRYICIIHSDKLHRRGWTPQTLANVIIGLQFVVPFLTYVSLRWTEEVAHRNGHDLMVCLGHYESNFYVKQTFSFCGHKQAWSLDRIFCHLTGISYLVTSINVTEMFIMVRIILATKSQTRDVKSLLTPKAFARREKEDGIMFSVNVLQWCLEVLHMIVFHIKINVTNEGFNKLQERMWLLYLYFHANLVNTFYLMGDSEFLRSVTEVGVLKSLQRAFFQSY